MAVMPRPDNAGRKIAFKLLGIPANMAKVKESTEYKRMRSLLRYEDTRLVR